MFSAKSLLRFIGSRKLRTTATDHGPTPEQNSEARAPSYQEIHVGRAAELIGIGGSRVLVVGANTGAECRLFVEMGAGEVHGIDVIEEVGSEFSHPIVHYHKAGIEQTHLPEKYFDLVYAVATMEHVHGLEAGFAEMVRVANTGGVIYSVASPLWRSPYGHHMGCFEDHPWVHVVYTPDRIIAYGHEKGITGERGYSLEGIVSYMTNPEFFNMRSSRDYVEACRALSCIALIDNSLAFEDRKLLAHPLAQQALRMGFEEADLLAVTHTFIARRL